MCPARATSFPFELFRGKQHGNDPDARHDMLKLHHAAGQMIVCGHQPDRGIAFAFQPGLCFNGVALGADRVIAQRDAAAQFFPVLL